MADPFVTQDALVNFGIAQYAEMERIREESVSLEELPNLVQDKADAANVYTKTAADARYAPVGADISVRHGTNPNAARPAGAPFVRWIGQVFPLNFLPGDQWDVSTQKSVEPPVSWFASYRADQIAAADLTAMTTWADSAAGGARPLTQVTTAKKPIFHVASGGVPAYLAFDGSKCMATSPFATPLAQGYTLIMTARMKSVTVSAATTKRLIDGTDTTNYLNVQQRGDGTNAKWQVSAGTTVSAIGAAVANEWAVISVVVNGSGSKIRVNGAEATGNLGALLLSGLTVGSKSDLATVFADFDTTDIRLAASALSGTQIAQTEAALANAVGIVLAA